MQKTKVNQLLLTGPQGALQASLSIPDHTSDKVAVVCHPHPMYGGTMNNKVTNYTARALLNIGAATLCFNFRGVGQSAGEFDNAIGEVDDCRAAVDWLVRQFPEHRLILAGFSFGAYVAMQAASQLDTAALITVAPAINLYSFSNASAITCPWLLIHGCDDQTVAPDDVREWLQHTEQVSHVEWMAGADHFFHGKLVALRDHINNWAERVL